MNNAADLTANEGSHHNPKYTERTSQRSDQSPRTANTKERAINWLIHVRAPEGTVMFFKTVFRRKGATAKILESS